MANNSHDSSEFYHSENVIGSSRLSFDDESDFYRQFNEAFEKVGADIRIGPPVLGGMVVMTRSPFRGGIYKHLENSCRLSFNEAMTLFFERESDYNP
jgi:hypothetical protein|tara:strand:- start:410 stop:700 length:291 start_codon:yes stop_codon:yes gene_type:complete